MHYVSLVLDQRTCATLCLDESLLKILHWPNIIFAHRPRSGPTCWLYVVPSCWHNVGPTFTFVKLAHWWQVHVGPTYRTLSGHTHDGSTQGQHVQFGPTFGQHVGSTLGQHLRQTSYVPE